MPYRIVRFTREFFDQLDEQLPEERPGDGTPSASDFLLFDLPPVRDRLAEDFELYTTAVPPDARVRLCIGTGVLVPYFALYAMLTERGDVEVLGVTISLE